MNLPDSLSLLAITDNKACRTWIQRAFAACLGITLNFLAYPNLEDSLLNQEKLPEAQVLLVDLNCTASTKGDLTRFWTLVRILYDTTPVVALIRPYADQTLIWGAFQARVEQYVATDASEAELRERVASAYHGQNSMSYVPYALDALTALLKKGPILTINVDSRQVQSGDECVPLTALETRVLAYLAVHTEQVVSWNELVKEVWKSPVSRGGTKDQVKSCIKRLRQKIEPVPAEPRYLLSVGAAGYKLVHAIARSGG